MAPERFGTAVLPARHADQPRADPPGRQRRVGSRAARHRDLQLPARRAAAMGVGDRHPRAQERPRGHRVRDARLQERRHRQHPRQLGRSEQGARGRRGRQPPPRRVRRSQRRRARRGCSNAACRRARRSPIRSASSSCWSATATSSARRSSRASRSRTSALDFVSAIAHRTAADRRRRASAPAWSGPWPRSTPRCGRGEPPLKCDVPGAVEVHARRRRRDRSRRAARLSVGPPGRRRAARASAPSARIRAGSIVYAGGRHRRGLRDRTPRDRPRREPHRQPLHASGTTRRSTTAASSAIA